MLKGAIHIHSTYSDGDLTLSDLRDVYRGLGCSFLAMTDHAEVFHAEKLERYVAECASLSDAEFVFVPGLEYSCVNRMHVLGLGVTALAVSKDPQAVIGHIADRGGISVIAHPMTEAFPSIEAFTTLPAGIEVWNSKYDGRYAPRVATFDLLARLRQKRSDMRAFYGQDMHWRRQFRGLTLEVDAARPVAAEVLAALRTGAFSAQKGRVRLSSRGELSPSLRLRFQEVHEHSERIRGLIKKARGIVSRWGMPVPPTIKAQLRRIF
jgi:predicted metal-dependent phosphoesterase TrpH